MSNVNAQRALQDRQAKLRKETQDKVIKAITTIREMGIEVTKKELIEITALSSATFSKQHVIDVLKEERVCQFSKLPRRTIKAEKNYLKDLELTVSKDNRVIETLESRIEDLKVSISTYKYKLDKMQEITEKRRMS